MSTALAETPRRGRPPGSKNSKSMTFAQRLGRMATTNDTQLIERTLTQMIEDWRTADCKLGFDDQYDTAWKFYHGDQDLDGELQQYSDEDAVVINRDISFKYVQRTLPLLTDARPVRHVRADQKDMTMEEMAIRQELGLLDGAPIRTDEQLASDLTEMWRSLEEVGMEEAKLWYAMLNTTIGGLSWRIPFWRYRNTEDPGSLCIRSIRDSKDVIVDPETEEFDLSDGRGRAVRDYPDVDECQRAYGLSDSEIGEILGHGNGSRAYIGGYEIYMDGDGSPEDYKNARVRRQKLERWWFWLRVDDYDPFATSPPEEDYGDESLRGWRVFVLLGRPSAASDKLVGKRYTLVGKPEGNPYWHRECPIIPIRSFPDPSTPYGYSYLHWLKHEQMGLNMMTRFMLLAVGHMGQPGVISEEGAFVNEPQGLPGEVWRVRKGRLGDVRERDGRSFPQGVLSLYNIFDQSGHEIINETVQGRAPGAQSSGIAISNLQNAALSYVRQQARLMEWSYQWMGRLEVSLLQQNGSEMMARRLLDSQQMAYGEWSNWHPRIKELKTDVVVESRAELPMNILDKTTLAFRVGQAGYWSPREFFKFTGLPISDDEERKLELAEEAEMEMFAFRLAQMRSQRLALEAQMAGSIAPGMDGGSTSQERPGGGNQPGTSGQSPVSLPSQSGVVANSASPV